MGGRRWKWANTVKDSMGMTIAKPLYGERGERSKIVVECHQIESERLWVEEREMFIGMGKKRAGDV